MTISRNNFLLTSIVTLNIVATSIIWFNFDNRIEQISTTDATMLSKLIISEINQLKTVTQSIDVNPAIAAVSAPDSEKLSKVIREVLESELGKVINSSNNQNLVANLQTQSGDSKNYLSSTQIRGKTEEPLSSEQIEQREHAMSQSTTIIDEAILSGSWDASNNEKIIPYVNNLSSEQRIELLEKFYGALNSQSLTLKGGMLPPL